MSIKIEVFYTPKNKSGFSFGIKKEDDELYITCIGSGETFRDAKANALKNIKDVYWQVENFKEVE